MAKVYKDYRDYLRLKKIAPIQIQRTQKQPGHLVLHSWAKEVEIAQ